MTAEEELIQLREENSLLREQADLQRNLIEHQQEHIGLLEQQNTLHQQQIALLTEQVKALQARLEKDSHNSHLPPSSDRFKRQPKSLRKKSGKQSGGQSGHEGHSLQLSETPDEVVRHPVERCAHCQYDLREVTSLVQERRQVIDLPPRRLIVQEHQAEQKYCPSCQQITIAAFPCHVRAPVQYGPRLGAIAVYLIQYHLVPSARASEIIADLMGPSLSVGTLVELVARSAHHLAPVEARIKDQLRQAQVLHQDETGLYVQGQRQWLQVR